MSSETIKKFKIIKVPAEKAYRKVIFGMDESLDPKKARHCTAAEMPVVTMGIPKKKYSRECPVTAPSFSEIRLPLTKPEYDITGKNIALFVPQNSDTKVGNLINDSCEYMLRKSRLHSQELERVLKISRTSNSLSSIKHMIKVIQADRNLKLSMHYMLLAEYARLVEPSDEDPKPMQRFEEP